MTTTTPLHRLALVGTTYAAALLICGTVVLVTSKKGHSAIDLLAFALAFPAGLGEATKPLFQNITPSSIAALDLIYAIYGVLAVVIVCSSNKKVLWATYAAFASLLILNIGGCAAIHGQIGL